MSVIPYVTVTVNGSPITSFSTSAHHDSSNSNRTDLAIELYETFTWTGRNVTMYVNSFSLYTTPVCLTQAIGLTPLHMSSCQVSR